VVVWVFNRDQCALVEAATRGRTTGSKVQQTSHRGWATGAFIV
jgi:hypothetical protein